MSQDYFKSVIGLEISEQKLVFAQLRGNAQRDVLIDQLDAVLTPPGAIQGGKIMDPEAICVQIAKVLSEQGYDATNMVVCFNDNMFIKHIDYFLPAPAETFYGTIFQKIVGMDSLAEELQISYQLLDTGKKQSSKHKIRTLYAAISKNLVSGLVGIVEALGLNLVAIGLSPISVYRTLTWNHHLHTQTCVSVYVDSSYVDIGILDHGELIQTQTIRKGFELLLEPDNLAMLTQKIHNLMLCAQNEYPKLGLPTTLIYNCTHENDDVIFHFLSEHFPDLSVQRYSLLSNFSFDSFRFPENRLFEIAPHFLSSVGLALKFFEPKDSALSFTKIKKQFSPVVERSTIMLAIVLTLLFIAGAYGSRFQFSKQNQAIQGQMDRVKSNLQILNSGQLLTQQKELKEIQDKINVFSGIQHSADGKNKLLKSIETTVPDDVYLDAVSVVKSGDVTVKGQALSGGSIHRFYSQLSPLLRAPQIKQIQVRYLPGGSAVYQFEFSFKEPMP